VSDEPKPALVRLIAVLRGDCEGNFLRRAQYYVFNAVAGGLVAFMIVAMATPSRDRGGQGFSLEIYLGAIAAGAVLGLAIAIVPRLLRPKDWPTHEEFRRGATPKRDDSGL
jgi:hypothetical protein